MKLARSSLRLRAFTFVELLVIIAIIAVLSTLLLSVLTQAKARATRTLCINNLRQINVGLRLYTDDNQDRALPGTDSYGYKEVIKHYLGLSGPPSIQEKVFACPNDLFHIEMPQNAMVAGGTYEDPDTYYSSYGINDLNRSRDDSFPGISGRKITSVRAPERTVLVTESSGLFGFSWHDPSAIVNNAHSVVSFVDGHLAFIRIYWDGYISKPDLPMWYDPPAGYDYKWSAD